MLKKFSFLFILSFITFLGFAQQTISLDQAREYRKTEDGIPENVTYVKDTDNRLTQFTGTWKGYFKGKHYEFSFIKKIAFKFDEADTDELQWDRILGWVTVKDSASGQLIFSNSSETESQTRLFGTYFLKNSRTYVMSFVGQCYNEAGDVFISIDKDNSNKMQLSFAITPDLQSDDCPNGFDPILPISPQHVILTKQ